MSTEQIKQLQELRAQGAKVDIQVQVRVTLTHAILLVEVQLQTECSIFLSRIRVNQEQLSSSLP